MAKIYDYTGLSQAFVILEDPRVSNDGLYLFDYKHDFSTLSPIFNKKFGTASSRANSIVNSNQKYAYNSPGYQMSLAKDYVSFDNYTTTTNSTWINIHQHKFWMSMDRNYKAQSDVFVMNNGSSDAVFSWSVNYDAENSTVSLGSMGVSETEDLSDIAFLGGQSASVSVASIVRPGNTAYWLYYHSPGNEIGGLYRHYSTTNQWFFDKIMRGYSINWPSINNLSAGYQFQNYSSTSFVGISSVDAQPIFATVYNGNSPAGSPTVAYRTYIYKCTGTTQTSVVAQFTGKSAGAAYRPAFGEDQAGLTSDGTTSGGNFANAPDYNVPTKPSRTMTDPRDGTGNTKLWYAVYIDDNSDYHPDLWTWDTSDDSFTLQTDVIMQAGAGQTAGFTGKSSGVDAWNAVIDNTLYPGMFRANNTVTPTSIVTHHLFEFNGERYITLIWVDAPRYYSTNNTIKTLLTWKIDAANPRLFTFHSKYVLPFPWQSHIFLNDEETLVGLGDDYSFLIIAFNSATGWETANTLSYKVTSIGRDSTDRIWYTKDSTSLGSVNYPELHLLTPSLPLTVTVVPAATSYTYAGVQIASTVAVNAYNAQGARISTDVKLLIEGTGMTFTGGTTITTITTSAADPIDVDIFINSAGFSNITASVDI